MSPKRVSIQACLQLFVSKSRKFYEKTSKSVEPLLVRGIGFSQTNYDCVRIANRIAADYHRTSPISIPEAGLFDWEWEVLLTLLH